MSKDLTTRRIRCHCCGSSRREVILAFSRIRPDQVIGYKVIPGDEDDFTLLEQVKFDSFIEEYSALQSYAEVCNTLNLCLQDIDMERERIFNRAGNNLSTRIDEIERLTMERECTQNSLDLIRSNYLLGN